MNLAPYVRILGRGPGRSRALTQDEAHAAMQIILQGKANPQAVGALLMLLRMKGETGPEIAGFVSAARENLGPAIVTPALDWPCYAAGRTRGLPWFLLAAKLVASAGHSVLLHGWNSHQADHASVRACLPLAGIAVCENIGAVATALEAENIAYLPLENFAPALLELLRLRDVLGLRSCINTVLRVLNPLRADAAVQGVFHPPYRELQQDAGVLLGQGALTIIKGGGGEFERHPGKDIDAYGLRGGAAWDHRFTPLLSDTRRMGDGPKDSALLQGLWSGAWADDFTTQVVIGTAALALDTLGISDSARVAESLWVERDMSALG